MIKHIIFDFDGTLIDTNQIIIQALTESVKNVLLREPTSHEIVSVLGKYLDDQMKYFDEDRYDELVAYYKQYYRTYQDRMLSVFPGIETMLKTLKDMGCKISIASAKGRSGILHGLELFGLSQYIDYIVSAYDVTNCKPDPECVIKVLNHFGCEKENMILIGDSPYDIQCGINAGIKTVLVSWSIFPEEKFQGIQPDFTAKNPMDIVSFISND